MDQGLVEAILKLELHNPLREDQVRQIVQLRQAILTHTSREYARQLDPNSSDKKIYPFICLENGDFIVLLGHRKNTEDDIATGSSKNVSEAIVIQSNHEVLHTVELTPKETESFPFEAAQGFLIREHYTLRYFHGHPNIAQTITLYEKWVNHKERHICHLMKAYEGGIIHLFYNIMALVQGDTGLNFIKQFVSVFFGFSRGLCKLHEYGVHGDISPANIFYKKTQQGFYQGVVGDLEGYQVGEEVPRLISHQIKAIVAPEVKESITKAGDMYAFGVTLMLVKNRFINQVVVRSVRDKNKYIEIADQMDKDIFGLMGLTSVIQQLMSENPEDRMTCKEVLNYFTDLMEKFQIPQN